MIGLRECVHLLTALGHLHLAYFATEITLHRCVIRSLNCTDSDTYLSHVCRSAAKTRLISAMDFVNRLRPEHLTSFWYFPSKINFALIGTFGSLLLATAPGQEEADFYHTRLAEYRWTLCVSSKSAEFLNFAVDSLDSSSNLLSSLPQKPSTSELSVKSLSAAAVLKPTGRLSPPQDEIMTDAGPELMQLDTLPAFRARNEGLQIPDIGGSISSGLASPSTSTCSGSTSYETYVQCYGKQVQEEIQGKGQGAVNGEIGSR